MEVLPIALILILGLAALPLAVPQLRRQIAPRARAGLARLTRRPAPPARTTVITRLGEEVAVREPAGPPWSGRLRELLFSTRFRVLAIGLLTGLIVLSLLPRLLPDTRADEFTVLVAPFREPGGAVGATGQAAAQQLAAELNSATAGRVRANLIDDPPADAAAAAELAASTGADAVLWGEISAGGLIDGDSLRPQLYYQPTGALAAVAWDGYVGRFAHPGSYALAAEPLNGRVVLPRLLGALADYAAGRVDPAFTTLGELADTPAVRPGLPRALRGTLLWARGDYTRAVEEYRRAIAALPDAPPADLARLYSNIGAVQQDARDPQARDSFNQAIALLQGQDLGELRFNLAVERLRADDASGAASSLEQARRLLGPSTPLLLQLAAAYRQSGQLDAAEATLDEATRRAGADDIGAPPALRDMTAVRLRAGLEAERALQRLARDVGVRGPVEWELAVTDSLSQATLNRVLDDLGLAVRETAGLTQSWGRRSAAADAEGRPVEGRVAAFQARRADAQSLEYRYWQVVAEIELAQTTGLRQPQGLAAVWAGLTGSWSPLQEARRLLDELDRAQPGDPDLALLRGFVLLDEDPPAAVRQFETAARLAPRRPEPLFGQGEALRLNDAAQARQRYEAAIALSPSFFPARVRLAELAEAAGDWRVAVEQRAWLAERRPGAAERLALAEALRGSGPSGYAEAERVLLELVNAGEPQASVALSRLYADLGDLAGAREVLDRALQRVTRGAPIFAELSYERGRLLARVGETAAARQEFEAAISANPRHVPSYLALAALEADPRAAVRHYRAALDAGASDATVLAEIGTILVSLREYETAVIAFERAAEARPSDAAVQLGLGRAYLGLGRLDAAALAAQEALRLQPALAEAQVVLGDVALERGQPGEAEQQYRSALLQQPQLAPAHIGLGRVAGAAGNWSVAAGHFRNAVAADPQRPEALLWLGEALVRTESPREAAEAYRRALGLREDYPEAHFGLAQALFAANQPAEAQAEVDRALALRSNYAPALLLAGKVAEQQGNDARALDSYGRAIAADGRLAEAYFRRALLLVRQGRLGDARGDLETAARLQESFPEAQYWLGRVYFTQRDYAAAAQRFRQAVAQRGGSYPEARYYQGLAEEQIGEVNQAIASFQAVAGTGDTLWAVEAQAALDRLGRP